METYEIMNKIKEKSEPSTVEIYKYIRFLINVKKLGKEEVFNDVKTWDKEKVENVIKEVERENSKPKPKRYYVSLKEPLEENY